MVKGLQKYQRSVLEVEKSKVFITDWIVYILETLDCIILTSCRNIFFTIEYSNIIEAWKLFQFRTLSLLINDGILLYSWNLLYVHSWSIKYKKYQYFTIFWGQKLFFMLTEISGYFLPDCPIWIMFKDIRIQNVSYQIEHCSSFKQ